MNPALRAFQIRTSLPRLSARRTYIDEKGTKAKWFTPDVNDKRRSVALLSSNKLLARHLNKPPFKTSYLLKTIITTQAPNLLPFDIVLLDAGLPWFTVESYIARVNPATESDQLDVSRPRAFHDLKDLYDGLNFARFAESTELSLASVNEQLVKWKEHLMNEAGSSLICIRDQRSNQLVPKRCLLIPGTATADWGLQLNVVMTEKLLECIKRFPDHELQQYQEDQKKMLSLFYVKRIYMENGDRHNFANIPFWKMEVMLKKWRTDQAMEEWSRMHRSVWGRL